MYPYTFSTLLMSKIIPMSDLQTQFKCRSKKAMTVASNKTGVKPTCMCATSTQGWTGNIINVSMDKKKLLNEKVYTFSIIF